MSVAQQENVINSKNASDRARAHRVSVLVDAEDYFATLRQSLIKAKKRIVIATWEFHSETELLKQDPNDGYPTKIGALLNALLEECEELDVYLLNWDYSFIYAPEREWAFASKWYQDPPPRLHCVADTSAPSGASHHQKLVVIDDQLAFCGGIDISISRWDTSQHQAHDERRKNPNGNTYPPFHDIQLAFDGDAAASIAELFSSRWENATGEKLPPLEKKTEPFWPAKLSPDFEDVELAISHILASPDDEETQMHRIHIDLIEAAERFIFIENQYLSSPRIADALASRLKEEDGPEVCLILPRETSGWLVENTVKLMRDRLLDKLRQADAHGRLAALSPLVTDPDGQSEHIYVHAKLLIVDDRILKIGSANLNNRSMSVDSELDVTLAFEKPHDSIRRIRRGLLAQHQDTEPEEIVDKENESGSILPKAVDPESDERSRQLIEVPSGCSSKISENLADSEALDPDAPIDPEFLLRNKLRREDRRLLWKRILSFTVSIAIASALGLGVYYFWATYLPEETARSLAQTISENPWAPLLVFLVFVVGGSIGIPLNLMLVTTAVVIGTRYALLYGVTGALVSSCIGYALGHALGKPLLQRLNSRTIERINSRLEQRSFRSVAVVRLLPVAPFFMINLAAGASRLGLRPYLLGTLLGMAPGMTAVVLLANRVEAFAKGPDLFTTSTLAVTIILLVFAVRYLRRALKSED